MAVFSQNQNKFNQSEEFFSPEITHVFLVQLLLFSSGFANARMVSYKDLYNQNYKEKQAVSHTLMNATKIARGDDLKGNVNSNPSPDIS